MKKIFIDNQITENRACYLFLYQQRKLQSFFENSKEYKIINDIEESDIIIIISCVVAPSFEKWTIKMLDDYIEKYPLKEKICYGCFSSFKDLTSNYEGYIEFVDNQDIDKFNLIFDEECLPKFSEVLEKFGEDFHNNFDKSFERITIGHGCLWNCYYCNHKLTKTLKSKPFNLIKLEVLQRLSKGVKHFRFTGDDVASYGVELDRNYDFINLFKDILKINDNFTFSAGPIYPKSVLEKKDEIINLFKTGRINELFIAIEHMNEDVLKKMNRSYNIKELLEFIKYIRKEFPDIKICTHIIYGFPGETQEQFEKLYNAMDYFDQIQFFRIGFTRYLFKNIPNLVIDNDNVLKKRELLLNHYRNKKGIVTIEDHRIITIKEKYWNKIENINYSTF